MNVNEGIKQNKIGEIFETLNSVMEDADRLNSIVSQTGDRIGVHFEVTEAPIEEPPPYGSLPQVHSKIRALGEKINDIIGTMRKIEDFI